MKPIFVIILLFVLVVVGTVGEARAQITINVTSTPNATSGNLNLFTRQTFILNATLSANGSIIWQRRNGGTWINLGRQSRNGLNARYQATATVGMTGEYRAILANNSSIVSNSINLTVYEQSATWNSTNNLSVSPGGTLVLNFSGVAPANATVTWFVNNTRWTASMTGVNVTTTTNNTTSPSTIESTLTIANFPTTRYGTYYAVIQSYAGRTTLPTLIVLPANPTVSTNVTVYNIQARSNSYVGTLSPTTSSFSGYAVIQENSTASDAKVAFIWKSSSGGVNTTLTEVYDSGISIHNTAGLTTGYKIITRTANATSSPGYDEVESFYLVGRVASQTLPSNATILVPSTYSGTINSVTYEEPSRPWQAAGEIINISLTFNRAATINASTSNFIQTVNTLSGN